MLWIKCVLCHKIRLLKAAEGLKLIKKLLLILRRLQPQNIVWALNYFDIINLTNYRYTLLNFARKTLLVCYVAQFSDVIMLSNREISWSLSSWWVQLGPPAVSGSSVCAFSQDILILFLFKSLWNGNTAVLLYAGAILEIGLKGGRSSPQCSTMTHFSDHLSQFMLTQKV